MGDECLNCDSPAAERYTLVFEGGTILEQKPLCKACTTDFRDEDWIDVRVTEVLLRGSPDEQSE